MIDATCPLVTKVHVEAIKFAKDGYSLILIGHRDHDEVIGTLGEAPDVTQVVDPPEEVEFLDVPDPNRVAYLTQTTLEPRRDERRDRSAEGEVPHDQGPHAQDICYATENRQTAVKSTRRTWQTCCWSWALKQLRTRTGWWRFRTTWGRIRT